MTSPTSLLDLPVINLHFPSSPIISEAITHAKQLCDETVYNHTIRSAYWALIVAKKLPEFATTSPLDLETLVVSCILHDLGWASSEEILSKKKPFEVDGADLARAFVRKHTRREDWDEERLQRLWYAIALHTVDSIAIHAPQPEVALTYLGIATEFAGPNMRAPGGSSGGESLVTMEEYRAVMKAFPRAGFNGNGIKKITCWLCQMKPAATYDSFVGAFGREFGVDGEGGGKEEYTRAWEQHHHKAERMVNALDALGELDKTA